jgi:hypothetical protein
MDGIEKYPLYYKPLLIFPYAMARLIGCFCYDSKLDNISYISFDTLERRDLNKEVKYKI